MINELRNKVTSDINSWKSQVPEAEIKEKLQQPLHAPDFVDLGSKALSYLTGGLEYGARGAVVGGMKGFIGGATGETAGPDPIDSELQLNAEQIDKSSAPGKNIHNNFDRFAQGDAGALVGVPFGTVLGAGIGAVQYGFEGAKFKGERVNMVL